MNSQIVRLYAIILLLFTGLVVFTSRWSVLEADELEANPQNRRLLIQEQQIERGTITSSDGVLIAESTPVGGAGGNPDQRVFVRNYPQGNLFANPVGYSFVEVDRTGIELAENDFLSGDQNEFASLIDELSGTSREGSDITLTLDAEAQRVATDALQSAIDSTPGAIGGGSVVAIEPDTGAVRVMASVPGYDPNQVKDAETFEVLRSDDVGTPLVNRPTQSTYEPGSTMKVVTAVAALDSGEFEPDTTLEANSGMEIGGVPLANSGGEDFGTISMTDALTNSVNTYWAQVGEQLGNETYFEYMERFGFNADPELNFPQMAPSGVYSEGRLLKAEDSIDIGRVAIGQERLLTTPLQMAQVAGTVANGGTLMEPTFLQEVKDPDGRTTEELDPNEQTEVMSDETAAQVTEMMVNVANEGTASGLSTSLGQLAGKTGTAEIDVEASINRPWFIGFAPAEDPQIAVAVMIERCTGCFGGVVAGPIATQVMDSLGGE
ncbi:MAG: penicillin-binding protein 2 [Actinomycetota bacterium]|nr:penicillin-binding protein 2 [Actinomycetota bacterium]